MILPLNINVGVTGHRVIGNEHVERVEQQVTFALQKMQLIAQSLCKKHMDFFEPNQICSIFSCLSEGADRLVAEIGLQNNFSLHAVLPFPVTSKINALDLDGDAQVESRLALQYFVEKADTVFQLGANNPEQGLGNSEHDESYRQEGYLAASVCMLEHSSVILALWHGKKQYLEGSTYNIIQTAIRNRKAIFWIHTQKDQDIHSYNYETNSFVPAPNLDKVLLDRFAPPKDVNFEICLQELKQIKENRFNKIFFSSFWKDFYTFISPPISTVQSVETPTADSKLNNFYDIFSELATYYGQLYRSFFLLASLLGTFAISIAVLSLSLPHFTWYGITDGGIKILCAFLELCSLASLWVIHSMSQKGQWQDKFSYYRLVTEFLRHNNMLGGMGVVPRLQKNLPFYSEQAPLWISWLISCLMSIRKLPDHIWMDVQNSEKEKLIMSIAEQVEYHENNAKRTHLAEHRLHELSEILFIATFICIVIGGIGKIFAVPFVPSIVAPLVIFLPLFAMGMHALSVYAEFHRLSNRSTAMAMALEDIQVKAAQAENYFELTKVAEKSISIMLSEVSEWSVQNKIAKVVKA